MHMFTYWYIAPIMHIKPAKNIPKQGLYLHVARGEKAAVHGPAAHSVQIPRVEVLGSPVADGAVLENGSAVKRSSNAPTFSFWPSTRALFDKGTSSLLRDLRLE